MALTITMAERCWQVALVHFPISEGPGVRDNEEKGIDRKLMHIKNYLSGSVLSQL